MLRLYSLSMMMVLLTQPLYGCQNEVQDQSKAGAEQTGSNIPYPQTPSSQIDFQDKLSGAMDLERTSNSSNREAGEESVTRSHRSKAAPVGISYQAGRLSISVNNWPLRDVLDAIEAASGLSITTVGDVGETKVSAELQDFPLDQGLRQLLQGFDIFFLYSSEANGTSGCTSVWIYPKGEGRGLRPVSPEMWVSMKEMESALNDHNPLQRARAYDMFIEQHGTDTLDIVAKGLADPNDLVRARVLSKALTVGVPLETSVLMNLLQSDRSPEVRSLVLDAASTLLDNDAPTLRMLAEIGAKDSSDVVSEHAKEILTQQAVLASPQETASWPMEEQSPVTAGEVLQ